MNGQGILTWSNGNRYVGQFKDNNKNGKGTYYFVSGEKYTGEWMNDSMNGQGIYTWSNDNRYVIRCSQISRHHIQWNKQCISIEGCANTNTICTLENYIPEQLRISGYVLACTTMYYHVLSCTLPMYPKKARIGGYVLSCIIMYSGNVSQKKLE
jgi:hypothetical protein